MAERPTWISAFLETLQAERNASANTVAAYLRDLDDFTGFLRHKGSAPETADMAMIEAYIVALDQAGLAASTRARRLSAIKGLFAFAYS